MLMPPERQQQIEHLVLERGRATVAELSTYFGVSEPTIRRDLKTLSNGGRIRRAHGGVVAVEQVPPEPPVVQRSVQRATEKQRIGRVAAGLIQDGETIFLGSGTTVVEVARNLGGKRNLTVITNALTVANELALHSHITVIITGGLLRHSEASMTGHIVEQTLRDLRADKVIMSIRAISVEDGLTNDYLPETMTDRAIIRFAREVLLLADHSKFGKVATSLVAPITAVHTIITDDQAPPETVHQLRKLGLTVIQG